MRERQLSKVCVASATAIVGVLFFFLWSTYGRAPAAGLKTFTASSKPQEWSFDPVTDARNLGLPDKQCDVGFTDSNSRHGVDCSCLGCLLEAVHRTRPSERPLWTFVCPT